MILPSDPVAADESLDHAIVEEVHLGGHDSQWAEQFVAERTRLREFLPGRFIAIEHIGKRYAKLKQELAAKHRNDLEAYADGKTAFINEVLSNADKL